jgi:DNA mismatch endonuclease (patch repair protein)
MADTRTAAQRSHIMKSVRTRNTQPEVQVRRLLHRLGLRFRLHPRALPGRPDAVLPRHRTAVFVHGCFWHAHGCPKGQPPRSRQDYWEPKLERNQQRDRAAIAALEASGWRTLVVWQCELKDIAALEERLQGFFGLPTKKSIDLAQACGYSSKPPILNREDGGGAGDATNRD